MVLPFVIQLNDDENIYDLDDVVEVLNFRPEVWAKDEEEVKQMWHPEGKNEDIHAVGSTEAFQTVFNKLPESIFEWCKDLTGGRDFWKRREDDDYHREEEIREYQMKALALGVAVDAGLWKERLGLWSPEGLYYRPLIMWGRRMNRGRRAVGIVGVVREV
ncbi:hypothetical protein HK097_009167 [Rhizophlyctis rosea]|uniref:Uncharacterized protein n=1 Tax=Rhizophlyctis rosea TaxID=64517 RepID=A0AAD5S9C1_9FUNG|nr:hypothetical protein HK097_009167 [Rhizophlyctis rosea]